MDEHYEPHYPSENSRSGTNVKLSADGNAIAIGAGSNDNGDHSGQVRLFDWNGSD